MESLDANVTVELISKLSGNDTVKLCMSSKKIRDICNKYEDIIWKRKLFEKYRLTENDIIGTPKSYYLGLENKKGWYYFYDDFLDKLQIKLMGNKKPRYDDSFFIPGIDKPKGKVVWIHFYYKGRYVFGEFHAFGKTLESAVKNLAIKIIASDDLYELNPDLISRLKTLEIGSKIKFQGKTYGNSYNEVDCEITVEVREIVLPENMEPFTDDNDYEDDETNFIVYNGLSLDYLVSELEKLDL